VKTPLLVRHPAPYPTESLLGYVLRLSEMNGYPSPSAVCSLAGVRLNDLGAIGLRIDRLAAIASCGLAELSQIAFARSVNGRRSSQLLSHRLVPRELTLAKPKLCPRCVVEKGFIEAHWHLQLMVACPIHRCVAISECPKCRGSLHWLRPGLLECDCGENLQDSDMPETSSSETALLDIIRRKLLGYPAADDNPLSLPQEQLMAMDLRSMLTVLRTIAKHRFVADRYAADPDAQQIILAASRVLMDWPNNFFVLLKDIGQHASTSEYGRVGKQYVSIYRAVCRNRAIGSTECTDFLRVAFLDFAMGCFEPASMSDDSSDSLDPECRRFLTDAEFAARVVLHQRTATSLLKTLKLSSKLVAKGPTRASFANKKRADIRRRRDPGMILDMVRHGSKLGRLNLVDLQIADGAGALFRREYVLLTTIAAAEQICPVELMRRCAGRNVRVLLLPIAKQGLQPIIRATDQGRITTCLLEDEGIAIAETRCLQRDD
jgi:hypothetical protein